MRLLPFGPMLPVHCCCDPAKRLGWVPVSEARQAKGCGPVRFHVGHPSYAILTGEVTQAELIVTTIEWLVDQGDRFLAVKSAEQSADVWKKVPGFIEERKRT